MRRGLVLAWVGVLIIGLIAVPARADEGPRKDPKWTTGGDPRACSAPIWPARANTTPGPGQGRRIVVIGDSLTRNGREPLTRQLRQDGWTPTIRCFGGKRLDWAIAQAQRAKELGQLPQTVVIAIGTNDMRWIDRATTKARMRTLLDVLGDGRTVFWVDTYGSGGDRFNRDKERWFNRQVRELAAERSNVHRIDWGDFARANKVPFADALHYTSAGTRTWARRVADEVTRVAGAPSTQVSAR